MVKFSKQLEAQIVPEWKEAFVDYWQLKKELKKIHPLNTENTKKQNQHNLFSNSFFSSLKISSLYCPRRREKGSIQVHKKMAALASKGDLYETELLEQFDDGEAAKEFFRCLDVQLNKVNQFYRMKEKEFSERGESLKRQMEILIELKNALNQQHTKEEDDDESSSGTVLCDEESNRGGAEEEEGKENSRSELSRNHAELTDATLKKEDSKLTALSKRTINFQGRSLRIHIPQTNPGHTFSAITNLLWDDMIDQSSKKFGHGETKLRINKTKLRCAEKMVRGALIELYKGLGYLKTYRNLNMLAFVKILKKFDKNTGKQVLPIYLKVVESSYFNSSDKALKLADEVEEIFIKHFSEDDKRKAMKYLKPTQKKDSHILTFLIGLFSGCFIALFIGYVFMAHVTGMYRPQSDAIYMETVYPVLSTFSLLFLHFFLYGCNIFMWRKARINYAFIFELAPAEELKYRDVFMICTISMAAVIGVLLAHLSLVAKGYSFTQVQAIPGLLLLVFLALLVCPFNIIYKSSRYRFLCVIRNIILSPLYKVVMLDFFMADQLCSQVPMLRNFEHAACYYITGSYKNQDYGYCMRSKYYRDLAYAVSFLPYYWRAMQCARRWLDEGHKSHLVNLGKYVSAMLAAGAKVAYEKEKSVGWLCLLVALSSAATVYQLYWDFVKDWGLLQFHSKNPWLRNELMLSKKFIYYFSMGLNLVLRLAWLQTVIHHNFGSVDYRVTGLFLAALEVIRRGQWNFYRLENEHLSNAGKFRAIKTVPLPFHEVDEED